MRLSLLANVIAVGLGLSLIELGLVAFQAGRSLSGAPFLTSGFGAARALLESGNTAAHAPARDQEVVDARNQRLKRAHDISMKHSELPKELQDKQTPYDFYLKARAWAACVCACRLCALPAWAACASWCPA